MCHIVVPRQVVLRGSHSTDLNQKGVGVSVNKRPTEGTREGRWRARQDLNLRYPAPEAGALSILDYAPHLTSESGFYKRLLSTRRHSYKTQQKSDGHYFTECVQLNKEKSLKRKITRLRKSQNPSPTDFRRIRTLRETKTRWWRLQKKPSESKVTPSPVSPKAEKKEEKPSKPEKEPELEVVDEELDELYDVDEKEESSEK